MPQHSQIAVTNYRGGRYHSQEFKIHMGLRFSPGGLRLVKRVFVLVQGVFVLVQGVFALVQGVFVLVQGVFVLVQGVFVLVQGVFALVQGVFVLVQGVFVLVQGVFVLVQGSSFLVHGVLGLRSSFLGLRFRNTLASPNVHRYHFKYCRSPWCFGENQRRSKIFGNFQKRMEQHFPKFLRKRTTSRGQLCVESFFHRVKFTSLCSYTSFPPRVVCVDGNKVKKL